MTYTIPILLNEVIDIKLPFSLFKDNNFEIFLADFPITDREILFDLKSLEVIEGKAKYKIGRDSFSTMKDKFPEFISSSYRLLIETTENTDKQIGLFNRLSYNLNLCCILYFNYPITLTIFGDDKMSKSQHSMQTFIRRSNKTIASIETLNSFKETLHICINNTNIDNKKKSMLLSLLNISILQSFNSGLICSTYITILESLFTDENTEITYRFAMRLTKYLNKDYLFFKSIKKLYGKRSSYYHSGEIKFDNDDELFLSNLTRQIIIDYLQCPSKFVISTLDEQLL